MRWRFLRSPAGDPALNMGLDEALLRADPLVPTLRTYEWAPWTLSLGYFQVVDAAEVTARREGRWGLVRRPTGGGAIFHGAELTFAVAWPLHLPDVPRETLGAYRLFHGILARALRRLGVPAELRGGRRLLSDTAAGASEFWCFYHSTAFDLAARGRKLVGSAQRRTARGFLMHGSIPLARNPLTPAAADAGTTRERLETAILAEWTAAFGEAPEPGEPTAAERAAAERLAADRYRDDAWTFRRALPRPIE